MYQNIRKSILAIIMVAILIPSFSFMLLNSSSNNAKIARADAISKIENVEDMDISMDQLINGNQNAQRLNVNSPKNDVFVNGEI
jgi:hypothetical protein